MAKKQVIWAAKFYVSSLDRTSLTGVINLDVCGYGDTIAICGKDMKKSRL